jgi:hypothetical protein
VQEQLANSSVKLVNVAVKLERSRAVVATPKANAKGYEGVAAHLRAVEARLMVQLAKKDEQLRGKRCGQRALRKPELDGE